MSGSIHQIEHIVLAPGQGFKCNCAAGCIASASSFMRCPKCRGVVASCNGHGKKIQQHTEEHCR